MFGKEPAVVLGGVAELFRQLVPMLIIFGFINWTDMQIAAVFAFSSAALSFMQILLTRAQTVTTEKADAQIRTAIRSSADTTVEQVIAKTDREAQ